MSGIVVEEQQKASKQWMDQASQLSTVPSAFAAAHAAHRDGRQRPPERVDEQGDRPAVVRNGSFEEIDGIRQLTVAEVRVLDHDHGVSRRIGARLEKRESTALGGSASKLLSPSPHNSTNSAVVM